MHEETKKYFPYNLTMIEYTKRYFHFIIALTDEKHYFSICFPLFYRGKNVHLKQGLLQNFGLPHWIKLCYMQKI